MNDENFDEDVQTEVDLTTPEGLAGVAGTFEALLATVKRQAEELAVLRASDSAERLAFENEQANRLCEALGYAPWQWALKGVVTVACAKIQRNARADDIRDYVYKSGSWIRGPFPVGTDVLDCVLGHLKATAPGKGYGNPSIVHGALVRQVKNSYDPLSLGLWATRADSKGRPEALLMVPRGPDGKPITYKDDASEYVVVVKVRSGASSITNYEDIKCCWDTRSFSHTSDSREALEALIAEADKERAEEKEAKAEEARKRLQKPVFGLKVEVAQGDEWVAAILGGPREDLGTNVWSYTTSNGLFRASTYEYPNFRMYHYYRG